MILQLIIKYHIQLIPYHQCFKYFFTNQKVIDYKTSKKSNTKKFHKLFTNLLKNGIFTAPSQYETVFLSDAHTDQDITKALGAYGLSLKAVKN